MKILHFPTHHSSDSYFSLILTMTNFAKFISLLLNTNLILSQFLSKVSHKQFLFSFISTDVNVPVILNK